MLHLIRHDYNAAGHRHADRYVRLRGGPVPLRYPDSTPTGFHLTPGLVLKNGRAPVGAVRLDFHERLSTPHGDLVFHRGGNAYLDAANVKYGHVAVADLLEDPGSPIRAGGRRGARFLHYGDPAADQGDRHDVHYTYLLWSCPNVRGGGMVRCLLRDGDAVDLCDVPPVTMDSYDEAGSSNGLVEAVYVRTEQAGNVLHGWTVSTHELFDDGRGPQSHLEEAP